MEQPGSAVSTDRATAMVGAGRGSLWDCSLVSYGFYFCLLFFFFFFFFLETMWTWAASASRDLPAFAS
jgi:hypothetical protein